jgi:hypothetical protein
VVPVKFYFIVFAMESEIGISLFAKKVNSFNSLLAIFFQSAAILIVSHVNIGSIK